MAGSGFWSGAAVVTGAGSGLGAAMVDRFAAEGMAIVALDIDGERVEAKAAEVRAAGGKAIALRLDVADRASLEAAAKAAGEAFGSVNVLCANVGVQVFGAAERLTDKDWRWALDVNVMGLANTVQVFLPLIRAASGNRRIVVTSSSSAIAPGVRLAAYITSKFAVVGYGEALRMELAAEGIGVSVLFPASMATRHTESSNLARPAALGESVILPDDIQAMMASRKMAAAVPMVDPEYATRHLLEEMAADRRYIVTHGDYREALRERCDDLIAALERAQS
jgi:NAD(P)-dependent dehydrogenase (short-subunit alcohol dehydrogenase family)